MPLFSGLCAVYKRRSWFFLTVWTVGLGNRQPHLSNGALGRRFRYLLVTNQFTWLVSPSDLEREVLPLMGNPDGDGGQGGKRTARWRAPCISFCRSCFAYGCDSHTHYRRQLRVYCVGAGRNGIPRGCCCGLGHAAGRGHGVIDARYRWLPHILVHRYLCSCQLAPNEIAKTRVHSLRPCLLSCLRT